MKHSHRLFLVIAALAAGLLPISPLAAQAGLSIDVVAGVAGGQVQLPIDFTNDGTIVAIQFDVTFNQAVLAAQDPLPGESLADHEVAFNQLTDNRWRIVAYSPTNSLLGSGTAVLLPLDVDAAAPNGMHIVEFREPVVISAAAGVALSPVSTFFGGVSLGDLDLDGVFDAEEAGAPNDGDANTDGTQDSEQAHVTSVQNGADGAYLTLTVDEDLAFMQVQAGGSPSPGDSPAGVDFPWGFLDFELEGLGGGIRTVVLTLPEGPGGEHLLPLRTHTGEPGSPLV